MHNRFNVQQQGYNKTVKQREDGEDKEDKEDDEELS